MKVKSLDESTLRYYVGMKRTPAMPCKRCGRKIRSWWGKGECRYCGESLPYSEAISLARQLGLWGY